ncbi:hypothetical protein G6F57_022300 [Rhizopus arrhizus]|nr:hypothetical protein G6F57_022300 [Rhizopus arrhizus]
MNALRALLGALTLSWGARLVVGAAADFGTALGWTPLLVGLLTVSIGTAIPERGQPAAGDRRDGHAAAAGAAGLVRAPGTAGAAGVRPGAVPDAAW